MLKIGKLLQMFHTMPAGLSPCGFAQSALQTLGIILEKDIRSEERVPAKDALVIVCNHPFGALDGLALLAAILPRRPDLRLLANSALGIFAELRPSFLPLDVLGKKEDRNVRNIASVRLAIEHLKSGGALGIFPAGTVSHWQRGRGVTDPEWQSGLARLARQYGASVLPVYFEGQNSALFHVMGLVHPLVRTLMLPKEILRLRGGRIRMHIGRPVEPAVLRLFPSPEKTTEYLRLRTYALREASSPCAASFHAAVVPIAPPGRPDGVAAEIAQLPRNSLLLREGEYAAYCFRGERSRLLLDEVGALRETAFRPEGEGTGRERDLDRFDPDYVHLILWNEQRRSIIGAYRIGIVRDILAEKGPAGLYSAGLFRMGEAFFSAFPDALELGRAVVHPAHQREYAPLLLLWKGIGRLALRRKARHLFGPVSLSLQLHPYALRVAVDYLRGRHGSGDLGALVQGRTLPDAFLAGTPSVPIPESVSYNELASLVRDLDGRRGLPILFKHYLKMGGKIGAFHMDRDFNTLDAFLLMDLAQSPRRLLDRYMGQAKASPFGVTPERIG
jgi:putative hemolysin